MSVWLWLCIKCGVILWTGHDAHRHERHGNVIKYWVDDEYFTD